MKLPNKDIQTLYNLPTEIKFCKKCTISNQRPRIQFDADGVCSACNFADFKRTKIDWESREQELRNLCDKFRKTNGDFDVLVPCSGGKDGSYVAYQLIMKGTTCISNVLIETTTGNGGMLSLYVYDHIYIHTHIYTYIS